MEILDRLCDYFQLIVVGFSRNITLSYYQQAVTSLLLRFLPRVLTWWHPQNKSLEYFRARHTIQDLIDWSEWLDSLTSGLMSLRAICATSLLSSGEENVDHDHNVVIISAASLLTVQEIFQSIILLHHDIIQVEISWRDETRRDEGFGQVKAGIIRDSWPLSCLVIP